MTTPLISVCIPAYNAGKYIEEAIRAISAQTYSNWELIINENCSTDDTAAVVDRVASELNDPRIRIFRNSSKLLAPDNWNATIQHARGEYLKLLCADDVPMQHCLATQAKALMEHPNVSLTAGARTIINASGKKLFTRCAISKSGVYDGREMIRRSLLAGTNIIGDPVVVLWRASVLQRTGLFDPAIVYYTDIEMWLRVLEYGDMHFTTEPIGFYRIHGNAAATGLKRLAVEDFLRMLDIQERHKTVHFNKLQRAIIATRSYLQGIIRQSLYRFLGT